MDNLNQTGECGPAAPAFEGGRRDFPSSLLNREITGNFHNSGRFSAFFSKKTRAGAGFLVEFPRVGNREFSTGEQGTAPAERGVNGRTAGAGT
jgi:hypothetical protein